MPYNIEIKARCTNPAKVHQWLKAKRARFVGIDHQVDTYFNVPNGRLKLREGTIENALIHYQRSDQAGPKASEVLLYQAPVDANLKKVLTAALAVKAVVDKQRAIYFIDNVKFHIDSVQLLGDFIEIEAIDEDDRIGKFQLLEQCRQYMRELEVQTEDLIEESYSDLIRIAAN